MEDVVIKTSGLTKDYGKGRGVFEIDLEVHKGEVFGFVGTNVPRYEQKTLPII